jgi:hypothetical protein
MEGKRKKMGHCPLCRQLNEPDPLRAIDLTNRVLQVIATVIA